jgi:hypothetical protein
MSEDIQEHMHALIAQHGSALAALVALQQQPEAHQNDKQTDSLDTYGMWYIERLWKCCL